MFFCRPALWTVLTLALAAPVLAAEGPLPSLPYTPSLEPAFLDRTADPCVDFYQFSCGRWLEKNPIPADRSTWSVYGKTGQDNQQFLWGLLAEAARPDAGRDADTRKVGDYFAACMDEAAIEKAGARRWAERRDGMAGAGIGEPVRGSF